MSAVSTTASEFANREGASSCTQMCKDLHTNSLVMRAVHAIWPSKTALALQEHTGRSERMVRYWIENKYSLSAGDLADLLDSEAGLAVLDNIMARSKQVWWKRHRQGVARSILRSEMKALQKRADQIEMDL